MAIAGAAADPRFCGSNFAYQHFPFVRFLDDMAELGRSKLELWGIAPHLYVPELVQTGAGGIRRLLRERGLAVHCFTPEQIMYPVNLASIEPWLLELSRRSMRDSIQVAADLGAPMMLVTTGRGYENQPTASSWARAVESLGALADIAAREGVDLLLEPLQRAETNLVTTAAELERMLTDVGRANLLIVLDTVAIAAARDTVDGYLHRFGERISHVHLADGIPTGHLAWGDGDLPLADYVRCLESAGYAGQYTFELFGNYASDPRNAIERCLNRAVASGV